MHIRGIARALALASTVAATAASAENAYTVDPGHSSIVFKVRHMMIATVRGGFDSFSGTITLDPARMEAASVEITVEAASITTNNEERDNDLRSDHFLDAANHPTITFQSKKIWKKGEQWVATGDLTMRGVTTEVEMPFTLTGPVKNPWGQDVIAAEASFDIDRTEYGASWNETLETGGVLVGEIVHIEVSLEAKKQ